MALALYRKYRPRTFAEVIGQEHVTEPLSQALRSGRLNHAYLFSGPRGCGKTSSARILARSLNCEQGPTPEPCGVCGSCKSLANDGAGSIDVIEIDAASHGGVDDARDLREKAFFAPASSRYKIYVIDEAHMVSSAGFNALLKLVEEPPEYVKFIFATTEPEKVLSTIRSRTHHYPFRLIPPAVLRPYIQQLTEAEGVHVDPAVFPLVVRAGGGSARDTLSVLDQLIAGAGPEGVSYARALALLGVTDVTLLDEMCDALAAGDGAAAYQTIDRVAEAGHDPRRFASDLLERFRDLIILQQIPDAVTKGLIDGPADQLEQMGAQATRLGPATLSRCADIVHNGLVEMRGTTAPRLLLELVTARMLLPGAEDSTGSLLQRLERMERRLTLTGDIDSVRTEQQSSPTQESPSGVSSSGLGGGGISAARAAAAAAAASRRGGQPASAPVAAASVPGGGEPVDASAGAPSAPVASAPVASVPVASAPSQAAPTSSESAGLDGVVPAGMVTAEPVSAAPAYSAPAAAAPTASATPVSAAPVSGAPEPAVPVAAEPVSAPPVSAATVAAAPIAAAPVSAAPMSSTPMSSAPVSSAPMSAAPVSGTPASGVPASGGSGAGDAEPRRSEPAGVLPDSPALPVAEASVPGQLTVASIREVWPEIMIAVGRKSKKIAALAQGATVRELDGNTVILTFRFPAHARMVAAEPRLISDALYEALGGRWQIRCDVGGDGGGGGGSAPRRPQSPPPSGDGGREPQGSAPEQAAVRSAAPRARTAPAAADGAPAYAQGPQSAPQATTAVDDDDGGWPEPARPGGLAAAASSAPAEPEPEDDNEWPEPARPGGPSPAAAPVSAASSNAASSSAAFQATEPSLAASSVGAAATGAVTTSQSGAPSSGAAALPAAGTAAAATDQAPGGLSAGHPAVGAPAAGSAAEEPRLAGFTTTASTTTAPTSAASATPAPATSAPATSAPATSARPETARPEPARSASVHPTPEAPKAAAPKAPSSAIAAARAAAARGAAPAPSHRTANKPGGPNAQPSGPNSKPGTNSWSDGSPTEEAPYDPDYDGPIRDTGARVNAKAGGDAAKWEGFDPGDEPLDEVIDEKTARQSSEQQAMQLLRDVFGAEKISES